jgi:lactate permease
MKEVWPACLVAGVSFAVPQFLVSNYHGPWVVDIVASATSIASIVVLLRFWQPKKLWRFDEEREIDAQHGIIHGAAVPRSLGAAAASPTGRRPSTREAWIAWMPWIILSLFVFAWGLPQVKDWLNGFHNPSWKVPSLHNLVLRAPPVVPKPTAEPAVFSLNYLSATGTGLLLAGIVSGLLLGVRPRELVKIYLGTLKRVRFSLLTIAAMLALGFTTRYAGSDATMGLAFASTGQAFPFFSAMLGWLGVALTGSDTSSNVLFGNLQQVTAAQVGISPVLAVATNSSGGVMGKMIDAQSIVVAGVATGQQGQEGSILRYVFFHSVALAALVGLLVCLQAYVFPGVVPH